MGAPRCRRRSRHRVSAGPLTLTAGQSEQEQQVQSRLGAARGRHSRSRHPPPALPCPSDPGGCPPGSEWWRSVTCTATGVRPPGVAHRRGAVSAPWFGAGRGARDPRRRRQGARRAELCRPVAVAQSEKLPARRHQRTTCPWHALPLDLLKVGLVHHSNSPVPSGNRAHEASAFPASASGKGPNSV